MTTSSSSEDTPALLTLPIKGNHSDQIIIVNIRKSKPTHEFLLHPLELSNPPKRKCTLWNTHYVSHSKSCSRVAHTCCHSSAGFCLWGGGSGGLWAGLLLLGQLDGHRHLAQVNSVLPRFGLSFLFNYWEQHYEGEWESLAPFTSAHLV